jgi:multiple sugar transport system permease protein
VSAAAPAAAPRGGLARRRRRRTLLLTLAGALTAAFFLLPFSWLVLTSLMPEQEAMAVPPHWLPERPGLANYLTFVRPSGTRSIVGSRAAENTLPAIRNSLAAAAGTAVLNLVLGTLAGYSFARLRFRGRAALLLVYLASRMVPGIALIVPLYLVQSIPRELEEAALVDGCTWARMLRRVLLPAAAPGLVAAAMFAFMTAWNDYLFAVILTSSMAAKTAPVVVAGFATDVTTERTLMAAGGVLAVIPPLILAFVFQRLIVQGLVSGAVKG